MCGSGIRQGCLCSSVTHVIGMEILAIKIQATPEVKGLPIPSLDESNELRLKLGMYADDITLFLQDENDLDSD